MSDEVRVLRSAAEAAAVKADWTRLSVLPETNWDLYWSSMRYHKPPSSPYVVAHLKDARLEGALVGRVERGPVTLALGYWKVLGIPVRRIVVPMQGLLGPGDEEALGRMIARVVEDLLAGQADVALFKFLEEGSPLHRAARGLPVSSRMRDRVPERQIHRYLSLPATFDEYHRSHKGLMQKVRKFERAFAGRYEYRLLTREDEVDAFCEGAEAVVRKSYQRALGVGFLNSEEDRANLMAAARQGVWIAFVALVEGRVVAFWSGCQLGASAFLWWTGYDSDLQGFSPGLVTSTRMVEVLIPRGVSQVDFGGGDAPYKERLGSESRWEESVCLFSPSLRGALANGIRALDSWLGNLSRTRLKGLANRLKTPWRRLMARKLAAARPAQAGGDAAGTKRDGAG